jgi:DEAD/DEAH box helicase domain-containing protein
MQVEQLMEHLLAELGNKGQVLAHRVFAPRGAKFADCALPAEVERCVRNLGIDDLYIHQAQAIEAVRRGENILVVTGTASGKTLCYTIPTLEAVLQNPEACILYLFPTKALAQDQLKGINQMVSADGNLSSLVVADTYDGDTPPNRRRTVRDKANVVISNPDMLHSAILPHHTRWMRIFSNLKYVVVDEIHTYRGIFGSHMANLLKRLRRICAHYGASPQFICSSATIANPQELAERLIGEAVTIIDKDGSPRGERHFILWQPPFIDRARIARRSSNVEACDLFTELVKQEVQTIVFTRARIVAELIYRYAREALSQVSSRLATTIMPYRGGYLPEERRAIERQLFNGELLGVTSTNALELGIDIGGMDACIMVGYPGTIASMWQQAGRAGRREQASLVILVPYENPVDQFLVHHDDYLFDAEFERAIIDPQNAYILSAHLRCASFELPLNDEDIAAFGQPAPEIMPILTEAGEVVSLPEGYFWSSTDYPAAEVNLRTMADNTYNIINVANDQVIGTVDIMSAYELLYPEAVYLHAGETYFVRKLDTEQKVAYVEKQVVEYYTQAQVETNIRITKMLEEKPPKQFPGRLGLAEVETAWKTVGFKKIRFFTMESIGWAGLDLPKQELSTVALYMTVPPQVLAKISAEGGNPYEGLLGIKNALMAIIPLYSMCDTMDIGGVVEGSNLGQPTIFVYDRYPGGLGFAERAYGDFDRILTATAKLIRDCDCEGGCPSCVGLIRQKAPLHYDPDLDGGPLIPHKELAEKMLRMMGY